MRLRRNVPRRWAAVTSGVPACAALACAALACGALLCGARTLTAQGAVTGVPAPAIVGVVRDSLGEPVADVLVRARAGSVERTAVTDDEGVFRIYGLPALTATLRVQRVGFRPGSLELPAARKPETAVAITLERLAPPRLDTVRVEAVRPVVARLAGFERRRVLREGSAFVTREDIVKRNPVRTSQMLMNIPGLKMVDIAGALMPVSTRGRNPDLRTGGPCVLRVGLDGQVLDRTLEVDQVLPNDIHGIEVFAGPATLPLEFKSSRTDTWCGLIMIWTRSG